MAADIWAVKVNDVEICRGPWSDLGRCIGEYVAEAVGTAEMSNRRFLLTITRARSGIVPDRTRTAGESRDRLITQQIDRVDQRQGRRVSR